MVSCTTVPPSPVITDAPEREEAAEDSVSEEAVQPEAVPDAGAVRPPVSVIETDAVPAAMHIPRLSDPLPVPPLVEETEVPGNVLAGAVTDAGLEAENPETLPLPDIPPATAPVESAPVASSDASPPPGTAPAPKPAPVRSPVRAPAATEPDRVSAPTPTPTSVSAARSPAASPPQEPEPETVSARPGDDITITLEGNGWIYLGAGSDGSENGTVQVRFLDRSSRDGNSRFLFSTASEGSAILRFQLQNSAAGTRQLRSYRLEVSAEDSGVREAAGLEELPAAEDEEKAEERKNLELTRLIERYDAGERKDSLLILHGLFEKHDGEEVLDLSRFTELPAPSEGELPGVFFSETFFDLLDRMADSGGFAGEGERVRFIEWLLSAVPPGERDLYYFRLGKLFEEKLFPRDPAGAVHYYSKIRLEYPWSRYWNKAVERERFLRRHYLELR